MSKLSEKIEERVQFLESEVDRLTLNCKGLVSDHHRNLKEIEALKAKLRVAIDALELEIKILEGAELRGSAAALKQALAKLGEGEK